MDAHLFSAINGLASYSDRPNDLFEFLAHYGPYLLVGLLAAIWFWPGARAVRNARQWAVINATIAAAVALGVNQIIIRIWERPRPFAAIPHAILLLSPSHDPSFPSDHATFAFGIAVALYLSLRRIGVAALLLRGPHCLCACLRRRALCERCAGWGGHRRWSGDRDRLGTAVGHAGAQSAVATGAQVASGVTSL